MRRAVLSLAQRRRRGSIGLEAVLAFPVVLLLAGVITQTMLLAQNRAYVEQAAYAAARSALVHECPPEDLFKSINSSWTQVLEPECSSNSAKWEDAARWALVSAAPSSGFARARNTCPNISAGVELITGHPISPTLREAVENRICYAFERNNVRVSVAWKRDGISQVSRVLTGSANVGSLPIEAAVTFRAPLTTPIQRLLATGERADGTRYREFTATVMLQ